MRSIAKHAATVASLLLALLFCQPVSAQSVSARVQWWGIYTVEDTKKVDDPTSPTGTRYVSKPIAPDRNTILIPARHLRFGMSYVLEGRKGRDVTVKHLYRFPKPGMPDTKKGGMRSTYEHVRGARVGDPVLMGWSFEGADRDQMVEGEWVFEVWQGGRRILDQRFTVGRRD